ncbi:sortase [Corynebacterium auriscanis]|uniref:sortase n=1 Tax=Corynebacterium auriscanis TaxID=99807 RepID=UPI003CF83BF3
MPQPLPTSRRKFTVLLTVLLIALFTAAMIFSTSLRQPDMQASTGPTTTESEKDRSTTTKEKHHKQDKGESDRDNAKKDQKNRTRSAQATNNAGAAPHGAGAFSMTGPAAIHGATYDVMPYQLPLNPAGPQATMVRWVDGLGVSPQRARQGTVYVLGHAWGSAPLVFNPISETVTAAVDLNKPPRMINGTDNKPVKRYATGTLNGSRITMRDHSGHARTWRVTNSWLVDKNEAIVDPDVMAQHRPGRIILIACAISGVQDLGYNVIVEGTLA